MLKLANVRMKVPAFLCTNCMALWTATMTTWRQKVLSLIRRMITGLSSFMDRINRVKWREPFRESVRAEFAVLKAAGVLRADFWLRVVILLWVVIGIIITALLLTFPGIRLPWPEIIAVTVIGPPAHALIMGMHALMPRYIQV